MNVAIQKQVEILLQSSVNIVGIGERLKTARSEFFWLMQNRDSGFYLIFVSINKNPGLLIHNGVKPPVSRIMN